MEATGSSAVSFGVFAALMYDIIAAACSSPQTAEINADKRAETLMKWVHLGIAQGAIFVSFGAYLEYKRGNSPIPPILGGGLAAGMMYASYAHAMKAGLESKAPGTES